MALQSQLGSKGRLWSVLKITLGRCAIPSQQPEHIPEVFTSEMFISSVAKQTRCASMNTSVFLQSLFLFCVDGEWLTRCLLLKAFSVGVYVF